MPFILTKPRPNNACRNAYQDPTTHTVYYCEKQDGHLERHTWWGIISPLENFVNHPPHYGSGTDEVINVIEAWQLDFCLGNAVKYIARAGKKDPAKLKEDLQKAMWYLQRKLDTSERT